MPLLSQIEIQDYRLFKRLHFDGLTRVNLIVGRNNSGKTALLEAVEAVVSERSPFAFYRSSVERGETLANRISRNVDGVLIEVKRWFRGHTLAPGTTIRISAVATRPLLFTRSVAEVPREPFPQPPFVPGGFRIETNRAGVPPDASTILPLIPGGFLGAPPARDFVDHGTTLSPPVCFITTKRQTATDLQPLWSRVVLTPEEEEVNTALRCVDASIKRVALSGTAEDAVGVVLLDSAREPVPIGSLGEGTARMLSIALNLAVSKGGYLIADEIDTGLHYSVMVDMWRLVIRTARRLDVQVFATTHSLDCVNALGWLAENDADLAADISLHRLERGYDRTTAYTADEIADAARHHGELR